MAHEDETPPVGPAATGGGRTPVFAPLTCAEQRTRAMLQSLPASIFSRKPTGTLQSEILRAVATCLCQWQEEKGRAEASTVLDLAYGEDLEMCAANLGIRRPNISLGDEAFLDLIRLCCFTPKGTLYVVSEFVRIVVGVVPTLVEPGDYRIVIQLPAAIALGSGWGLAFYGAGGGGVGGRGYPSSSTSLGYSYAMGPPLSGDVLDLLNTLTLAGVRTEVVYV